MVIADMDFETYSEAGYLWDVEERKWRGLPGAAQGKKGLPVVGMAAYAMHASTEVLTFSYNLKDGRGVRRWRPGTPNPQDLFDHLAAGKLVEAWNAGFERWIWQRVCVAKYGWPPLPVAQLRCAMAKSRAFALPGALGNAAKVLQLPVLKDEDGKRLLKKFSEPRNPTKSNAALRIFPADDPNDAEKLYSYCDTDTLTEAEASSRIPDLEGEELAYWQADQAINERGVYIDLPAVEHSIAVIEEATRRACTELVTLTGGAVSGPTKVQDTLRWLAGRGCPVDSLDEDTVVATLKRPLLPPDVRRVLEIRRDTASAAVKKLFAMRVRTAPDGRARDLFNYHATRTGRCTMADIQPGNLPNSGIDTRECPACQMTHGAAVTTCPHCGTAHDARADEWGAKAADDALAVLSARSVDYVEHVYGAGSTMAVVSSTIRGMFRAAPGHDLMVGDYSAIEAVGLAELSGEQWRRDVFNSHGKIYEASAAEAFKTPLEEILRHKKETGDHHPLRKKGKVMELACFTARTQVLTNSGYKPIVLVTTDDLVWDGLEWVSHDGVVYQGEKGCVVLDGVEMTPNQRIFLNDSWKEASQLVSNQSTLSLALETALGILPWSKPRTEKRFKCSAAAARRLTSCRFTTYGRVKLRDARRAAGARLGKLGCKKGISSTPPNSLTRSIGKGYLTDSALRSSGATPRTLANTTLTAAGGFASVKSGDVARARFLCTCRRCLGGISRNWRWIGSITTKGMRRETFDSCQKKRTTITVGLSEKCKTELTNSKSVFDIVNAGPRNRFTIRTESGHLIVHNCGYGGWVSALRAFGADAYMNEDEMRDTIVKWRNASPSIVEFWGGQVRGKPWAPDYAELYGVEGMAIAAIRTPGRWFDVRHGVAFKREGNALYCRLPSGRLLTYHKPRLVQGRWDGTVGIQYEGWNTNPNNGPVGWITMNTHGGKLVENITQAACRDLLRYATLQLERNGYPVVMHVYDEIISEVPHGRGDLGEFMALMADRPGWARDWPIRVGADAFRETRYRK